MMEKLKMQTPNKTEQNIEQIAQLFPNVVTEFEGENGEIIKGIDFDLLKQQLTDVLVDDDSERYRLDWPGKKESLLKANTPITKTLRPCREESVNFDTTENLYLEGDNFEVLKILQESYLNKVKMIYIDPPYNTGKDFVYTDKFKIDRNEYEEELGMYDEEDGRLFRNTDSNGRFHSDWLCMMYERLLVARDLLKDDGVIFISIDDNEVHNLRKICDEVFGEENFVSNMIWQKKNSPQNDAKTISSNHDHILLYSKSINNYKFELLERTPEQLKKFKNLDNDPRGPWSSGDLSSKTKAKNHSYPITSPGGKVFYPPKGRQWAPSYETFLTLLKDNKIYFGMDNNSQPKHKQFLNEIQQGIVPTSILLSEIVGSNTNGIKELRAINLVFDSPKPSRLIKHLLKISCKKGIILDFFSGSATTAHAVMQLNAEDGGNRKFIMVQLPEKTDESSEAFKAGYKTISDIGKERIRRAGKQILEELKAEQTKLGDKLFEDEKAQELESKLANLDIGFRVYKTDTTNMKDVYYHPEDLDSQTIEDLITNLKEDRTAEDLLTQVILDLGLELNLPIEVKKIKGNSVYFVQHNSLVACFDDEIDFAILDEIAQTEPLKVVFKDASFKDDKDKINLEGRFKRLSPATIIKVL